MKTYVRFCMWEVTGESPLGPAQQGGESPVMAS
jgi:hypothetical protein